MNEICLSRNKAVTSLLKLQNYRVADDEILTVYEFLNEAGLENAASHEFHFANGSSTDNANSLHITNMDLDIRKIMKRIIVTRPFTS